MTEASLSPGSELPDDHHVLRYIQPRHIHDGVVNGGGFLRRPEEEASSVNWLEHFDPPPESQVSSVRNLARLKYAATGKLVRLNVGETRNYIRENSPDNLLLKFVHDQLGSTDKHQADPSHALIHGLPTVETPETELVKDLLVDCILEPIFPSRPTELEADQA